MTYRATLLLIAVLLSGCLGNQPVIDASSDFRHVTLPPDWREDCVGEDGFLRTDTDAVTQQACKDILGNNLILKGRK